MEFRTDMAVERHDIYRKAKNKKKYYICENNPKTCDYISWNKPKK